MAAVKSAILFVVTDPPLDDDEGVDVPDAAGRGVDLADLAFTFGSRRSDTSEPAAVGGALVAAAVDLPGAGDWVRDDAADEVYGVVFVGT